MTQYIHGETDPAEVARLETQARFLSRWILDGVEVGPSARVLDLACGTGAMSRRLRARFPDALLTGSDLSLAQLRAARDEQIRLRDPIPLVQSTAAALPFAGETFDAVHASWLLEHVSPKDVVPILREARRVLRKNGTLYLCEVENDSLFFWPRQPLAEEIARALWEAQAGGGGDPIIGRKLYGLCTAAGFTHVEVLPTTLHIHAGSPAGYLHGILNEFSEILRSAQHALPERLRGRVEDACAQLMSLERDPRGSFTYTMFRVRARP
jgi:ubiquinone/menaquinone biosynthesis C-methylase UbiE